MLLLQVVHQHLGNELVEIIPAKLVVAMACQHLYHLLFNTHNRDIKGATTQIVDQNGKRLTVFPLISDGSGSGFVDDTLNTEPRDLSRFTGGLTLCIGEEGGYSDHRSLVALSALLLGNLFESAQNHCRDLLRGVVLISQCEINFFPHMALHRVDGTLWVQRQLVSGGVTDQR